MKFSLEKKDWLAGATLLVASVVAGIAGHIIQWGYQVDVYSLYLLIIPGIVSLYYVYKGAIGGKMGVSLEYIAAGIAMQVVLFVPQVQWHLAFMPSAMGISTSALYVFFHGLSALGVGLMVIGFHKMSKDLNSDGLVSLGE